MFENLNIADIDYLPIPLHHMIQYRVIGIDVPETGMTPILLHILTPDHLEFVYRCPDNLEQRFYTLWQKYQVIDMDINFEPQSQNNI